MAAPMKSTLCQQSTPISRVLQPLRVAPVDILTIWLTSTRLWIWACRPLLQLCVAFWWVDTCRKMFISRLNINLVHINTLSFVYKCGRSWGRELGNSVRGHTANNDSNLRLFNFPNHFRSPWIQRTCFQTWWPWAEDVTGQRRKKGSLKDGFGFLASLGCEKCLDRETFLVFWFRENNQAYWSTLGQRSDLTG